MANLGEFTGRPRLPIFEQIAPSLPRPLNPDAPSFVPRVGPSIYDLTPAQLQREMSAALRRKLPRDYIRRLEEVMKSKGMSGVGKPCGGARTKDDLVQEYIRAGMSPQEADRSARTVFGEPDPLLDRATGAVSNLASGVSNAFRGESAFERDQREREELLEAQERERRVQWYMSQGMGRKDAESEVKVDYGELDPAFSRRNLKDAAKQAAGLAALAGTAYVANKYVFPVVDRKSQELLRKI